MLQPLSLAMHTLYADLLEQGLEDLFDSQFPENGSILVRRKGSGNEAARNYAYYQGYRLAAEAQDRGRRYSRYVGPTDDPAVGEWIAQFQRIKAVRAERSSTVDALIGSGMPRPPAAVGRLIEGLAKAGLFPSRAILIGAAAYQTYSGVLGVRLSRTLSMGGDDLARPDQISVCLKGRISSQVDVRHIIDPSFAPPSCIDDEAGAMGLQSESRFRLVHVTASRGDDARTSRPTETPEPGSAATQTSRGLDFLVDAPVRSIVLHGPGITVTIPSPERYAVHTLIVHGPQGIGSRGQIGTKKDFARAAELIEALVLVGREHTLGRAFSEAWEREPTWRIPLSNSVCKLPDAARTILEPYASELSARSPAPASPQPHTGTCDRRATE